MWNVEKVWRSRQPTANSRQPLIDGGFEFGLYCRETLSYGRRSADGVDYREDEGG